MLRQPTPQARCPEILCSWGKPERVLSQPGDCIAVEDGRIYVAAHTYDAPIYEARWIRISTKKSRFLHIIGFPQLVSICNGLPWFRENGRN